MRDEATSALGNGDHKAAIRIIREAVRQAPDDAANIFMMATILSSQHRYHEAIQMLDQFAEQTPEAKLPVLGQTAEWLVMQGAWDSAEARYRQVIEYVPDAAMVHRPLAHLLLRQGRRVEAGVHLQVLCRLGDVREEELRTLLSVSQPLDENHNPETDEPIGVLGEAWSLVSRQQMSAAIDLLLPEAKRSVAAYGLLGRIHVERDDAKTLSTWWDGIAQPEWATAPELQLAIGAYRFSKQQYAEAKIALQLAVQYDPTDFQAYSILAKTLDAEGDEAGSRVSEERSRQLKRTQQLAVLIKSRRDDTTSLIQEIIDSLDSLQRPFESLSWQVLYVVYRSDWNDDVKEKRIMEINAKRLQLL